MKKILTLLLIECAFITAQVQLREGNRRIILGDGNENSNGDYGIATMWSLGEMTPVSVLTIPVTIILQQPA